MTKLQKLGYLALLSTTVVFADTIGGEISLGIYSHSPSGYTSYETTSSVDLEDDLKWSTEQDMMFKAYIEHPLPFLPNIKLGFANLSHDGKGSVTAFSWGDIININGDLDSALDMQMYDVTAYYELLDNTIEVDAGITLRYLDGTIDVTVTPLLSPTEHEIVDFNTLVPMLYGKAKFNIPTTDISLQFEGNAISYEDTTFYDYEISARYTFTMGLGIEAGYKALHLDSEDLENGLSTDMDFKGPYASLVWDF
ncbi:MAG: hypothetical protein P794_01285 [Epsilonproteobacteria bacterium (ex Lamellibrachia satsuma)]|nr:MAG: hypothetical protein P794_01285 [Epsilonproteobacteria bacterium (ex Lamellibrachia satsuma)]